ncbi:MAG: DNA adenine methylase, partial [Gammaproteobacteria bacterium]
MTTRIAPVKSSLLAQPRIHPPLKWAGGKYRILDRILTMLPSGHRLVEPFFGSGAVFFNTDYKEYLINDLNSDLVLFYRALAKRKRRFIDECAALFKATNNRESAFYELRTEFNETR